MYPDWEYAADKVAALQLHGTLAVELMTRLAESPAPARRLKAVDLARQVTSLRSEAARAQMTRVLERLLRDEEPDIRAAAVRGAVYRNAQSLYPAVMRWAMEEGVRAPVAPWFGDVLRWFLAGYSQKRVAFADVMDALRRAPAGTARFLDLLMITLRRPGTQTEVEAALQATLASEDYYLTPELPHLKRMATTAALDCVRRLVVDHCTRHARRGTLLPGDAVFKELEALDPELAVSLMAAMFAEQALDDVARLHTAAWLVTRGIDVVSALESMLDARADELVAEVAAGRRDRCFHVSHLLWTGLEALRAQGHLARAVPILVRATLGIPDSDLGVTFRETCVSQLQACRDLASVGEQALHSLSSVPDHQTVTQRGGPYLEYVPGVGDVGREEPVYYETSVRSRRALRDLAAAEIARRRENRLS